MISWFWNLLNGKKTVLGYVGSQLAGPTVVQAVLDAATAWSSAAQSHDYNQVVQPTAYAMAQLLLLVGVSHKVVKQTIAAKAT